MKKIRIGIDMDNTIEDLVTPWISVLNSDYGLNYTFNDIKYYDMEKSIPELNHGQIYSALYDDRVIDNIKPYSDAIKYIELLNNDERFEVYIVTNTHYKNVSAKMERVLFKYFPFLKWKQLICISNKQLLNIDYLIDDYEGNLLGGGYKKILFTAPYNKEVNSDDILRFDNWEDIYNYFNEISC